MYDVYIDSARFPRDTNCPVDPNLQSPNLIPNLSI